MLFLRVNDVRWIGRQTYRLGKRITKFYGTIVKIMLMQCIKSILSTIHMRI